jgi:TfoX/Sxy family transcriptional regulator of competence genes
MDWKKTPPALAARFDRAAPKDPRMVRRVMFGYPALFLNGNMFAFTFGDQVVVRLSEPERRRAMKSGAKEFGPMPERPMKEYVALSAADVAKPAAMAKWVAQARTYAATLPEKKSPVKKKATKKKDAAARRS